MNKIPYDKYDSKDLILRDHLAMDRTILANERTYLAYIRTAFTMLVVGFTFIKFFKSTTYIVIGWIFIPIGIILFFFGSLRYQKMKSDLDLLMID